MKPEGTDTHKHPRNRGLRLLADTIRDYHCARIRAQVVVDLLHDRGVAVGDADHKRILTCEDLPTLRAWTLHATTAVSAEEFVTPKGPRIDLYEDTPNAALREIGDEFEARFGASLRAQALLDLLEDLGVRVELPVGVRIYTGDVPTLRRWTLRVAEVHRPPELFEDPPDPLESIDRLFENPTFLQSPFAASYRREYARGQAKVLLVVLGARGIEVDGETRARVHACTDVSAFDRWIVRAANANTLAEVFDAP